MLIKEVIDNSVDEYAMGHGKVISVTIRDNEISVRDYGRGIPFGKVIEAANKMNTGAKYDNKSFQKAVGLNGVGLKAVNATSNMFYIETFREGKSRFGKFSKGVLLEEGNTQTDEKDGTLVRFIPDPELFPNYTSNLVFVQEMMRHYAYLNKGLKMQLNGNEYVSKNGLLDPVLESRLKKRYTAHPFTDRILKW